MRQWQVRLTRVGAALACVAATHAWAGDAPHVRLVGELEVAEIAPQTVLVLPMTGSYEQHGSAIPQLMMYAGMKQIIRGAPFGVYYDNPESVPADSLRWEVCVPVPEGTRADPPFEVRALPAMQGAVAECLGPYEEAAGCYGALVEWAGRQGLTIVGPPQEHWLSDMQTTPPESLRTRLIFPVVMP